MLFSDLIVHEVRACDYPEFKDDILAFGKYGGDKFVKLRDAPLIVIGDVHGDLRSLETIFAKEGELGEDTLVIFLGDYGDRGDRQLETWWSIIRFKSAFPNNVVTVRGNHEPLGWAVPVPHDLPLKFDAVFGGERGGELYGDLFGAFENMVLLAESDGLLFMHGGLPVNIFDPLDRSLLDREAYQFLWNDPADISGYMPSPRGLGYLFGEGITIKWLKSLGANYVVRGHEPCDGFKFDHNGRVVTIFSCKGPPYFNQNAAYMKFVGGRMDMITF